MDTPKNTPYRPLIGDVYKEMMDDSCDKLVASYFPYV